MLNPPSNESVKNSFVKPDGRYAGETPPPSIRREIKATEGPLKSNPRP